MFMVCRTAVAFVAKAVIVVMCTGDQQHCRGQEPVFVLVKKLFHQQEQETRRENNNRQQGAVVFYITVKKGVTAHGKSQCDHTPFKSNIMNDVDAKQRKACKHKGQHRTMDSTCHRGGNSNNVPVKFYFHVRTAKIVFLQ